MSTDLINEYFNLEKYLEGLRLLNNGDNDNYLDLEDFLEIPKEIRKDTHLCQDYDLFFNFDVSETLDKEDWDNKELLLSIAKEKYLYSGYRGYRNGFR